MFERIAGYVTLLLWIISFLGGLFATAVFVVVAFDLDVPFVLYRGVEGLAFGLALAVIPYCLARAFDELASEVDDMDLSDDVVAVRIVSPQE